MLLSLLPSDNAQSAPRTLPGDDREGTMERRVKSEYMLLRVAAHRHGQGFSHFCIDIVQNTNGTVPQKSDIATAKLNTAFQQGIKVNGSERRGKEDEGQVTVTVHHNLFLIVLQ